MIHGLTATAAPSNARMSNEGALKVFIIWPRVWVMVVESVVRIVDVEIVLVVVITEVLMAVADVWPKIVVVVYVL